MTSPKPHPSLSPSMDRNHQTPKLQLFFDWDETITAHDTLSLIPPPNTTPPFSELGKAYMDDLNTFQSTFKSTSKTTYSPQDIAQMYDLNQHSTPHLSPQLCNELAYLYALDHVEVTSVNRTEKSGIFIGWDPAQARERAASTELVQIRQGWRDIVTWLVHQPSEAVEMHIISVSWSSTFIRAGLESHPHSLLPPTSPFPTTLNANDPSLSPTNLGNGTLSKSSPSSISDRGDTRAGIRTGKHKLDVFQALSASSTAITVYVGDSSTDLPCLLHVHIGILIGNKESMLNKLDGLGIEVESADSFLERWGVLSTKDTLGKGLGADGTPRLVGVQDWRDVLRILHVL
ncbi:hypothetical protein CF326_g7945 [Tilletia indica]|nr:hypothetical protein CF326_g7945 [Tilletia indica]